MHCHPYVNACFRKAVTARAPIALISESYDPRGVRGLIRRVRSRWDAIRVGAAIRAIFAMGAIGERWFRAAGFPGDRIYSFAYVTPVTPAMAPAATSHPEFRILYVGQLIPRKGVDVLLQALATCRKADWTLTIVGNGPAESGLKQLAVHSGVLDRVTWVKSVPNTEIARMMAGHDLLVLPSRYDGWGAVVNEAITVGTPVICSDACGAADLIRSSFMGEVVRAGSAGSLAEALQRCISVGSTRPDVRRRLAAAAERFSPSSVADYFLAALEASFGGGVAPCPPWRADP
jgi:glycosyltransferase involved in cell wall biosynthesis